MYIVCPCFNSSINDLVFITDIPICLPGYVYLNFPPFLNILAAIYVVNLFPLKCMYTCQKTYEISIEDKNELLQKLFLKVKSPKFLLESTWKQRRALVKQRKTFFYFTSKALFILQIIKF